ncbi:MAG: hypothetical protein ACHQQS_05990 [Thermoanaerobaculales bacterium]
MQRRPFMPVPDRPSRPLLPPVRRVRSLAIDSPLLSAVMKGSVKP